MKTYRANFVPGTGREIMGIRNGKEMQRAQIYLPGEVWEKLRALGIRHGVSDSIIVEQLVELATATHP